VLVSRVFPLSLPFRLSPLSRRGLSGIRVAGGGADGGGCRGGGRFLSLAIGQRKHVAARPVNRVSSVRRGRSAK
jgi:hypothetical protein